VKPWPSLLVADDDENDLGLIARALPPPAPEQEICFVHDGSEALDYLYGRGAFEHRRPELPGCVLLDLNMPRVNGWDVLRQVRADPRFKAVPIVVFSSSDRESDVRRCYELGATAYVVKPMDSAAFRQAVLRIHDFWITCNLPWRGPGRTPDTPAPRSVRGTKNEIA
jgi:CheY-like chemotaxis protein